MAAGALKLTSLHCCMHRILTTTLTFVAKHYALHSSQSLERGQRALAVSLLALLVLSPTPPAMAESPVFNVGSRVSLVWPMESGRVTGKIVSLKHKKICRKRAHPSKFQYLLQWDDGTPPRWSRLLHLNPQLLPQEPESLGAATKAVHLPLSPLPWDCDDGDHCETPALAYAHIAPILALVASSLGTSSNLKLYDPYYCAGSASTHLRALGFPDVYNRPVDFYAAQSSTPPDIPPFDLLVSNPPFSKDHPRRCMSYALNSGRPFLLLLPNYEACSTWLSELLKSCNQQLLYLAPHKRYVCRSPPSLRCGSNKALKYVAPFPLLWFIGLPDPLLRSQVLSAWQAASSSSPPPPPPSPGLLPLTLPSSLTAASCHRHLARAAPKTRPMQCSKRPSMIFAGCSSWARCALSLPSLATATAAPPALLSTSHRRMRASWPISFAPTPRCNHRRCGKR